MAKNSILSMPHDVWARGAKTKEPDESARTRHVCSGVSAPRPAGASHRGIRHILVTVD